MHFFWIFGHPEVYVLVLPAFAFIFRDCSGIFPQSDFRLPGDGRGIDLHCVHRYERLGPSHVHGWYELQRQHFFRAHNDGYRCSDRHQDIQLAATMWGGKIHFKTPMLFAIGFLFQFLIAGLTGIMLGVAPFNWHLGNSYFVVAHFHYVIVGGILFAAFGAFYYWFRRCREKMYSEALGRLHFWLFVIGFI